MRFLLIVLAFFSISMANATARKEIVLTKDNTLILNQAFTGQSVSTLIGQAKKLDANMKSGYPIYLFLNTPGGSVQAGLELIEFFRGVNRPVHTITLFAASMGWQLVQNLGQRYVLQYGVLMSHKASGGFRGEFGGGGSQLDSRYHLWLRRLGMLDQQTVDRTNGKKTLKQYQSEYDNELWLNGAEAVERGYADAVVNIRCDNTLEGTTSNEVRAFGFNIAVDFDKCPLRTSPVSVTSELRTNKGYMSLDKFMSSGGKFGKRCRAENSLPTKDWNGNVAKTGSPAELCLMDTELTLVKIQKAIEATRSDVRSKNTKIVRMSFGNFVTEL